jgi:hypothetical protein
VPKTDGLISSVKVRPGTDKVPFFGDVRIEGFGKILGCPVWKKDGKFRPGLPMRKGEKQSFTLLELDDDVEHAVFAALIMACNNYEELDVKATAANSTSPASS